MHRHYAVEAADRLSADGVGEIEVLDLRTISPLDVDAILESVRRTSRCLVVHEDNRSFGVGAEVAAVVAEEAFYDLDAPVRRLCIAGRPELPLRPAARSRAVDRGGRDRERAARAARRLNGPDAGSILQDG